MLELKLKMSKTLIRPVVLIHVVLGALGHTFLVSWVTMEWGCIKHLCAYVGGWLPALVLAQVRGRQLHQRGVSLPLQGEQLVFVTNDNQIFKQKLKAGKIFFHNFNLDSFPVLPDFSAEIVAVNECDFFI